MQVSLMEYFVNGCCTRQAIKRLQKDGYMHVSMLVRVCKFYKHYVLWREQVGLPYWPFQPVHLHLTLSLLALPTILLVYLHLHTIPPTLPGHLALNLPVLPHTLPVHLPPFPPTIPLPVHLHPFPPTIPPSPSTPPQSRSPYHSSNPPRPPHLQCLAPPSPYPSEHCLLSPHSLSGFHFI